MYTINAKTQSAQLNKHRQMRQNSGKAKKPLSHYEKSDGTFLYFMAYVSFIGASFYGSAAYLNLGISYLV